MMFLLLWGCATNSSLSYDFSEEPSSEQPASEPEAQPSSEPSTTQPEAEPEECTYPDETAVSDPLDLEGRVHCGEESYMQYCAGCHGSEGEGNSAGPALMDHLGAHMDQELVDTIVEGKDAMPPFNLHAQEIADLVAYMRDAF